MLAQFDSQISQKVYNYVFKHDEINASGSDYS